MPYVGNKPEVGNFRKCDAITTSATATYNLLVGGVAVNPNQNQCIVSLNGVVQSSGDSFTCASSQITFASALTSSDVIDFILILGDTLDVGVPSDDTVDASKITANIITGQTALGATPADTDELLISDAGTLKRVDYSYLKSSVVNRPNAQAIIINGDCAVSQRSTSETGKTGSGIYTVDRMALGIDSLGTWTVAQESLTSGNAFANGFTKAFRIDCTTANASPSASNNIFFQYKLEGNSVQAFKKGTANAEKFTLSFWVKSNKTGTAQVLLQDKDNSRNVGATYSISSANTWEQKVLNFPADTTGAFGNDNNKSLEIEWSIDAGTDFTSGTLPATWTTANNNQRSVNDLALGDNTANDWAITGIQLEVGEYTSSTLPPFQHESYAENLRRCQRYYYLHAEGTPVSIGVGNSTTTSDGQLPINFPTAMRTLATIEVVSGTNYYKAWRNNGTDEYDGLGAGNGGSVNQIMLGSFSNFSTTVGTSFWTRTNNASAKVAFSAEL